MSYKIVNFKTFSPVIDPSSFIADGVIIAGDVKIGKDSSIWFNSVLRGDVAPITIGNNTNIQDGCVVHTSRFDGPTFIGNNITIGHLALIHACVIHDNAFVGMHSTVMDKAIIEQYGFVAAGSLVTPGKIVKEREMWAGRPAKYIRNITDDEYIFMKDNVENYVKLSKEYKI